MNIKTVWAKVMALPLWQKITAIVATIVALTLIVRFQDDIDQALTSAAIYALKGIVVVLPLILLAVVLANLNTALAVGGWVWKKVVGMTKFLWKHKGISLPIIAILGVGFITTMWLTLKVTPSLIRGKWLLAILAPLLALLIALIVIGLLVLRWQRKSRGAARVTASGTPVGSRSSPPSTTAKEWFPAFGKALKYFGGLNWERLAVFIVISAAIVLCFWEYGLGETVTNTWRQSQLEAIGIGALLVLLLCVVATYKKKEGRTAAGVGTGFKIVLGSLAALSLIAAMLGIAFWTWSWGFGGAHFLARGGSRIDTGPVQVAPGPAVSTRPDDTLVVQTTEVPVVVLVSNRWVCLKVAPGHTIQFGPLQDGDRSRYTVSPGYPGGPDVTNSFVGWHEEYYLKAKEGAVPVKAWCYLTSSR